MEVAVLQLSEGRGGEGSGGGGPAAQERAWEESYCVGEGDKTEEIRERGGLADLIGMEGGPLPCALGQAHDKIHLFQLNHFHNVFNKI